MALVHASSVVAAAQRTSSSQLLAGSSRHRARQPVRASSSSTCCACSRSRLSRIAFLALRVELAEHRRRRRGIRATALIGRRRPPSAVQRLQFVRFTRAPCHRHGSPALLPVRSGDSRLDVAFVAHRQGAQPRNNILEALCEFAALLGSTPSRRAALRSIACAVRQSSSTGAVVADGRGALISASISCACVTRTSLRLAK